MAANSGSIKAEWIRGFQTGATRYTVTDLLKIAGVTNGTTAASKALVTNTDKAVSEVHTPALYLGAGAGTLVGATAAELNYVCDASANVSQLTASGAVPATARSVELNHATVAIAATIADASVHPGLFVVKDTSASGTAAHTCVITTGTWDGTNKTATLNAPNEALVVYFDAAGNGTIVANVGTVSLSA